MKKTNFIKLSIEQINECLTQDSPAINGFVVRVGVKNLVEAYDNSKSNELHEKQEEWYSDDKSTVIIVRLIRNNRNKKRAKLAYVVYPQEVLMRLEYLRNVKIKFNFTTRPA